MKEFAVAVLPWLFISVAIALFAVNYNNGKRAKKENKEHYNYIGRECAWD